MKQSGVTACEPLLKLREHKSRSPSSWDCWFWGEDHVEYSIWMFFQVPVFDWWYSAHALLEMWVQHDCDFINILSYFWILGCQIARTPYTENNNMLKYRQAQQHMN